MIDKEIVDSVQSENSLTKEQRRQQIQKHDKVEHKLSFRNITENVIIGQLIGYLHHKIEFYKKY